jgi:hypothetical protein
LGPRCRGSARDDDQVGVDLTAWDGRHN